MLRHTRHPPGGFEAALQGERLARGPILGVVVADALGHVGEIPESPDRVDGDIELLLPHAFSLDVAQPLGPAVSVMVELTKDVAHVAYREGVHLIEKCVVAGPAPHERDRARELRSFIGVAGIVVGAEVDGAVADDLVHDLAAAVDGSADVAQRPEMGLDRAELAHRYGGVGCVFAVGGEQPRVIGIAGGEKRAHSISASGAG